GVTANDPRRKEIQLCYSILSKPEVRKHYDEALSAGRKITWPEIEHLANFESWPDPVTRMNVSENPPQTHAVSSPQGTLQQEPQRQSFIPPQPQQQSQQQPQAQSQQQPPYAAPFPQPLQPAQCPYAQSFTTYQQVNYFYQLMVSQ